MKRVSFLLLTLALGFTPMLRAQDAATEERLNKLSGRIDDIMAAQDSMRKQISDLAKEIAAVREQASKPTGNYANAEDLNRLKKAVEDVDRKRMEDADKIHSDLVKLQKELASTPLPPAPGPRSRNSSKDKQITSNTDKTDNGDKSDSGPASSDKVFPYVIQKGDSLSVIVQAYREKNIKVTVDQILKANPGLNENKLRVGQKIYIPAPASSATIHGDAAAN